MKRLVLLVFILISSFCVFSQSKPTVIKVNHENIEREYIVYVPENLKANKAVPLLIGLHGSGGSAYTFMHHSGFNTLAEKENFIAVYPQGSLLNDNAHWNVGGWARNSTANDIGFIGLMIQEVKKSYNIDSSKIFAAGMSNGGYLSFQLACEMGDVFAAVASVTGSMTPETHKKCTSSYQVPVLQIHGTSDSVVPYNGRQGWSLPIDDVVDFWVEKNNALPRPKIKKLPDLDTTDNSTVVKYTYKDDSKKVMVIHYKVLNGRHDWFGNIGNKDIHANKVIWEFFSKQKN